MLLFFTIIKNYWFWGRSMLRPYYIVGIRDGIEINAWKCYKIPDGKLSYKKVVIYHDDKNKTNI